MFFCWIKIFKNCWINIQLGITEMLVIVTTILIFQKINIINVIFPGDFFLTKILPGIIFLPRHLKETKRAIGNKKMYYKN